MRRAPLLLVLLLAAAAVTGGTAAHGYEPAQPAVEGTNGAGAGADRPDAENDGAPQYAFCNMTEPVMAEVGGSMRSRNLQNCASGLYPCNPICGGCCGSA